MFGFQSTNISPRLCTGRLPCRLPGSIAASSCEYEDRPAEVLGVPGKCLQRPKHADVTRFGERPARQMMFFEDRADQTAVTLEHPLEGRQQRVGGRLGEQRKFVSEAGPKSCIGPQARQLIRDPIGKRLTCLTAEIDLCGFAPHGEEKQGRG